MIDFTTGICTRIQVPIAQHCAIGKLKEIKCKTNEPPMGNGRGIGGWHLTVYGVSISPRHLMRVIDVEQAANMTSIEDNDRETRTSQ